MSKQRGLEDATSAAMVRELLSAGADPFAPVEYGTLVETIACNDEVPTDERVAMLRLLTAKGLAIDEKRRGLTPIWCVACNGSADAVAAMLGAGADPRLEFNALGGACWPRDFAPEHLDTRRKIDLLIAAGCRVDHRDGNGFTPLHGALMPYSHGVEYASSDGCNVPAASALIAHGASIDITFRDGHRPLHVAASQGCPAAVELLLRAGAAADEQASTGETPVDLAQAELARARDLPTVESYRKIYRTETDAKLAERVETMVKYFSGTLIPNARRCVELLMKARSAR